MISSKPFRSKLFVFRKRLLGISCIPMFVLCSISASAVNGDVVTVATMNVTNYGFIQDGEKKGVFYEIANSIVIRAGYTPENTVVPYPRAVFLLKNGTVDLSIMLSNKEIEKAAEQLSPIFEIDNIVVGLAGFKIKSLEDLQGKIVAGLRNAHYDSRYDDAEKIVKFPSLNYIQSIKMLINGRVDAVIGTRPDIFWTLRKLGIPNNTLGDPITLNTKSIFLHFSKKSNKSVIKPNIISAAESLSREGVFEDILARYSNHD